MIPNDFSHPTGASPIHPLGRDTQVIGPAYSRRQRDSLAAIYRHFEQIRLGRGLQTALLLELCHFRSFMELSDYAIEAVEQEVRRFTNARSVCRWLWEQDPGAGPAPTFRFDPPLPDPGPPLEDI